MKGSHEVIFPPLFFFSHHPFNSTRFSQSPTHKPTAPTIIAPTIPDLIRSALPVKGVTEDWAVGLYPLGNMPVANVDRPAGGPAMPVGIAWTGAGPPAARSTSGGPVAPASTAFIVNLTCGTVTRVERIEIVEEYGMG